MNFQQPFRSGSGTMSGSAFDGSMMGQSAMGAGGSVFGNYGQSGAGRGSFGGPISSSIAQSGQSAIGAGMQGTYGESQGMLGGGSQSNYNQYQQYGPTAMQYHTANYRGDQPTHDQDLRGDSFRPAQQGGSAYVGRTGFLAAVNPSAQPGGPSDLGRSAFDGGMMGQSSFGGGMMGQSSMGTGIGRSTYAGGIGQSTMAGRTSFDGGMMGQSNMGQSNMGMMSRGAF